MNTHNQIKLDNVPTIGLNLKTALSLLIITLFLNAQTYGQKLFKATYTNKEGEEQTQEFDKLEDALDDNNYWTHYPEENLYWFPLEVTITQTQDDNYYVNKQTLSPGRLKSPDSENMRSGVKRYILNLQNVSFPENAAINVYEYGIIIQNIILNSPLKFNIPSGPVLEIKGGTFKRKVSFVGTDNIFYGILKISGGTFTNGQNDDCALSIENIYSVEISGGDFRYQTSTSSNLNVSGPTAFKVVSNRNDIKITGGTFGPANPDANINGTGLLVEAFDGIMKISGGTFKGNPGAIKNITGRNIISTKASLVDNNGSVFTEKYNNSSYLLVDNNGNFSECSVKPFDQYLELSNEGKTLTFKYGLLPEPFGDNIIELMYLQQTPRKDWSKVETVVFDQSYTDNVLPTSCAFWFSNFENLKEIQNLDKLNTSKVTNMYGMFMNCSSLETIDISTFSTASLKKDEEEETVGIKYMFYRCKKLKSITLYNPETPSVHFTPNSNITSLSGIFSDCNALETIDLSYFDIGTNITDMSQMFYNCYNLTTILVDQNIWKTNDGTYTNAMFSGCINLIGNNGTQYDDSQTSGGYAHVDENENPGYFTTGSYKIIYDLDGGEETGNPTSLPLSGATSDITLKEPTKEGFFFTGWSGTSATGLTGDNNTNVSIPKGSKGNRIYTARWAQGEPYAVVSGAAGSRKMTFYYGVKPENNSTQTVLTIYQDEDFDSEIFNNWKQNRGDVIEVIFDESFKDWKLATCSGLFAGFSSLTTITNIKYFDASQVKDMSQMFSGCSALERIDLNINTSNVEDMSYMFQNCWNLQSIDFLNSINTSNVTDMSYMFNGCSALESIDLNINTEKVTDMSEMFQKCSALKSVNLDINTSNVKDMHCMFTDCSSLIDITFGDEFTTANVKDCSGMFYGCTSLTKPIDMSLFDLRLCEGYLGGGIFMHTGYTNIVLKDFKIPEGITSMHQWFQRCEELVTIDLRGINTKSVTDFSLMFAYCKKLKTIIVDDGWIVQDANCNGMFSDCFSLEGKYGTKYDEGKTDGRYARVDVDGAPGYLSDGIYTISYIHKDQNGNKLNITLDNYNYPTKYTYDDKLRTIFKPTSMQGYTCKEWSYTISTDKTNKDGGEQINIPQNSVGNYEITITWDVVSKLKIIPSTDFISFPTDWKKFCKKQETEAILTYSLAEGSGLPTYCNIIIETIEGSQQYYAKDGAVHISKLPQFPGEYTCSAVFVGDEQSTTPSDTIKFTLEITAARGLILQLYKNVIFVNNSSEKFETYQWYRYGEETDEKLKNGERQYFTEPTLKGSYWALLNGKIHACYMEDQPVIVKQAEVSISTYPNPAVEGEQFTIEINNFDPDTEYSLIISNSNGNIIKQLTVTKQQTTLSLPRGFYTGALMWSGNKQSFKIIVR